MWCSIKGKKFFNLRDKLMANVVCGEFRIQFISTMLNKLVTMFYWSTGYLLHYLSKFTIQQRPMWIKPVQQLRTPQVGQVGQWHLLHQGYTEEVALNLQHREQVALNKASITEATNAVVSQIEMEDCTLVRWCSFPSPMLCCRKAIIIFHDHDHLYTGIANSGWIYEGMD